MDLGLTGRHAIVSGASAGIGFAVAWMLSSEGASVVMAARDRGRLEDAADRIRTATGSDVWAVAADMSTRAGIEHVVGQATSHGEVDIVVTNVASPTAQGFDDVPDEEFFDGFRSMVMSFAWIVKATMEPMKRKGWGRYVNIGADCVIEVHRELPLVLTNSTRAGAVGLQKSLADRLGPFGITVNNLAIGGVLTESRVKFHEEFARARGLDPVDVANGNADHIPLKRFGDPDEVAATVAFLCSRWGGFITGETIAVDGGRTRRLA